MALLRARPTQATELALALLASTHHGVTEPAFRQSRLISVPSETKTAAGAVFVPPRFLQAHSQRPPPMLAVLVDAFLHQAATIRRNDARGWNRSSLIVFPQSNTNQGRRSNDRAARGQVKSGPEPSPVSGQGAIPDGRSLTPDSPAGAGLSGRWAIADRGIAHALTLSCPPAVFPIPYVPS